MSTCLLSGLLLILSHVLFYVSIRKNLYTNKRVHFYCQSVYLKMTIIIVLVYVNSYIFYTCIYFSKINKTKKLIFF